MNIYVENYQLSLDENEMFNIIFSLRDTLKLSIDHCAGHNGYETLLYNYQDRVDMMEKMCTRLGRVDIFEDAIKEIKKAIEKRQIEISS